MRVMVVEDEPIQCLSLVKTIATVCPGAEVTVALDGADAIAKARKAAPDAVFLDILMPGMSGLEAGRQLRAMNPAATLFVLTAHESFDFAQQAVGIGVAEYLLKPVAASDLKRCLDRAAKLLSEQEARAERDAELRKALAGAMPLLRAQFVRDLCRGLLTSPQEYSSRAALVEVAAEPVLAISIALRPGVQGAGEVELEVARRQVTVLAEGLAGRIHPGSVVGRLEHEEIAILLPRVTAAPRGRVPRGATGALIAGIEEIVVCSGLRAAAGIGGQVSGPLEIWVSYLGALKARQQAWLLGEGPLRALSASELGDVVEEWQNYPRLAERGLEEAVRLGEVEATRDPLRTLTGFFAATGQEPAGGGVAAARRSRALECLALLSRTASEAGAPPEAVLESTGLALDGLLRAAGGQQLAERLTGLAETLATAVGRALQARHSGLAARAAAVLAERFPQSVGLGDVADALHVSPFYLSHVFHESMGLTFSEYLTGVRVGEAKRLLDTTDLPVAEVSARAGYREPNYFGRVFKRVTGLTPLGWRRRRR